MGLVQYAKRLLLKAFSRLGGKVTWTGLKSFLKTFSTNLVTWTLILFKKKILLGLSVITTLSGTVQQSVIFLSQGGNLTQLGSTFVSELYINFLGAAPNIAQGLSNLISYISNPFQLELFATSIWSIWLGVSSVYIFLVLYTTVFVGKIQEDRASWREKYLFLGLWISLSLVVHPEKTLLMFQNLTTLGDLATEAVWESNLSNSIPLNETANVSS